jgi:heme oxygenase (mycobilin-producing)
MSPAEFIALSRMTIANDMVDQVKDVFVSRRHLVDAAAEFIRMSVISPCDDRREIWLFTYWRDEESCSHLYHASHQGIPKGLKLVPRTAQLRFFDSVCT